MIYKYCSVCGSHLRIRPDGKLACTTCQFVNYLNPRPCVTALVIYDNKLLLTKRKGEPFPGWWDLPGGFMDAGETPPAAIKRELKEETGLDINIDKFFGIYPGTYPSANEPFSVISIVYLIKCADKEVGAYDDVSESRWFDKKELPSLIAFDSNQNIIKDFLKIWN